MVRWAQILEEQGADQRLAAFSPAGVKDVFCRDWPIAKPILQSLLPSLPLPLRLLTSTIIAMIDAAYQTLCPAK
ncbi:MAG TPA: hypothetical protein VMF58_18200 [Rhizomicrobium sp.]|nr:hypothetical protein [Rhizomicrobium sp.]